MDIADLKKIASNIAVIAKTKTDVWTVETTVPVTDPKTWIRPEEHQLDTDYLQPVGTFNSRQRALREARKLNKAVVAEKNEDGQLKILDCATKKEYLNGLALAIQIMHEAQGKHKELCFTDPGEVILKIQKVLEEYVQRAQHYMVFEKVTPPDSLLDYSQLTHVNSEDENYSCKHMSNFKLADLQKISPRVGIIEDVQDGWGFKYKTTENKSGVYRAKQLKSAQTTLINQFSCDLVAIRAEGEKNYTLLYCDAAKNYIRGLTAAALAAHQAAHQPFLPTHERLAYLQDQLTTLANYARKELGYKNISRLAANGKINSLREEDKIKPRTR